jgi:UDP-glucose 4-epimerase
MMALSILVTGGHGFIGQHVRAALRARGLLPVSFDRACLQQSADPQILGDVRDEESVNEAVARVEGVIHLAAVLGTQETVESPSFAVQTNIGGSLHVFRACARWSRPCVYITVGNHWMQNPYSITKTCAERFAWMANQEWGARIAVVRAFNAYGPGQKAAPVRKIIPTFLAAALAGQPIEIYGDGSQIMDMIHVRDLADILVRALFYPQSRMHPFEAGTGRRLTVREIADTVASVVGSHAPHRYLPMRPGEPPGSVVVGDPETLRPLYDGTLPDFLPLEEGLAQLVTQAREEGR